MLRTALKLIIAGSLTLSATLSTALVAHAASEPTHCVTPDGYPYTTSYAECPPPAGEPLVVIGDAATLERHELPQTGTEGRLVYTGLALLILGLFCYLVVLVGQGPTAVPPIHTPRIESE